MILPQLRWGMYTALTARSVCLFAFGWLLMRLAVVLSVSGSEQFDVNITRIGTKLLTCTGDLLLQRGLNVTASVQTGTARSSVGFRTGQLHVGSAAAAAVNGFVTTGPGVVQAGALNILGSATVTGALQAGTISTASLSAGMRSVSRSISRAAPGEALRR